MRVYLTLLALALTLSAQLPSFQSPFANPSLPTTGYGGGSIGTTNSPSDMKSLMGNSVDKKDSDVPAIHIDENSYYLGTGDAITAVIWGLKEERLTIHMTTGGNLIVPSVGSFAVGNKSFAEIKAQLTAEIKKKFRAQSVDFFLSKLKTLEVPVYGEVKNPGVYTVNGSATVATLIQLAGGFTDGANRRGVEILNNGKPVDTLDVQSYIRLGNQSPRYSASGDRIFVPTRERTVSISGAVSYPDRFDYTGQDTLSAIIKLAGGLRAHADSSRIVITRFLDNNDSLEKIVVPFSQASTVILQPEDRILVSQQKAYREARQVTVLGEVQFPGVYAIRDDKTPLVDVVKMAGGLTDQAFPEASWITRTDFNDAGANEFRRLSAISYEKLSPEERSYVKYRASSNMNNRATVSLDFAELMKDGTKLQDIILRSGDVITIAKKDLSVNVMGAVVRPGLVAHKEGADYTYYINQAGGFKQNAVKRQGRVIKAGTEIWLKPRQAEDIAAGDALWVPEEEYVPGMERTRNIITVISGIATLIMATVAVVALTQD